MFTPLSADVLDPKQPDPTLGKHIRSYLLDKHIRLDRLARPLGVTNQDGQITRILNQEPGRRKLTASTVKAILAELNIHPRRAIHKQWMDMAGGDPPPEEEKE